MSKNADKKFEVKMPQVCEIVLQCLAEHADENLETDIDHEDISRMESITESEVDEALFWLLKNNFIECSMRSFSCFYYKLNPNSIIWYHRIKVNIADNMSKFFI